MRYGLKVAAVAVGVVAGLAFAAPANAETLPAEPWQAVNTGIAEGETGWTPDAPQVPSSLSHVVDPWTAHLEWAAGDATSALGTSVETADLGLAVEAGAVVSVQYVASTPEACDSGAVRAFASFGTVAEVNTGAAALYQGAADCDGDGGTITFTIPDAGTVAYAGLVFDTSNGGVPGTVTFSNLTVGGELVLLAALCEWDAELAATDEQCQPPASPTPTPSPTATGPASAGTGGSDTDASLPVTGGDLPLFLGGAAVLAGLGGGLLLAARKRGRPTFTAE